MNNNYLEHLQDSQFTDTWQAAEANQFLADEAHAAECERDEMEAELLEHFRAEYPNADDTNDAHQE